MADRPEVSAGEDIVVFSYGTLRQSEVQQALFGRCPESWADAAAGYQLEWITITDPEVVRLSGSDRHPILVVDPTGESTVEGVALRLSPADLRAADDYEVDAYGRSKIALRSGISAWVYGPDATAA